MLYHFNKNVNQEYRGTKGRLTFADGEDYEVTFQIYLLNSGYLIGSVWFTSLNQSLEAELNTKQTFVLNGKTQNKLDVMAEGCSFYSITNKRIDQFPYPIIICGFTINTVKVYDGQVAKSLNNNKTILNFEFGILNYYSTCQFSIDTEVGNVQKVDILTDDEIPIFRKSFMPFISSILELKVENNKPLQEHISEITKVISKILDLTSFALTTEHKWCYYKVFKDDTHRQFIFSKLVNTIPKLPNSHNNISDSCIQDFLNLCYRNYDDHLETYNFSFALKWYLDSLSLKYDVMQFISASIALETILAYSEADQFILDGKTFKKLRKSLAKEINDNLQEQVPKEDILSIVGSLSQLNRRHYKNKVIELLQSLGIFDTGIEKKLSNIIKVRNKITHTGKFKDLSSKDKSVVEAYFELFNILSKIFFRLLVNDLEIYKKEFHDMEWQQLK
jgi:hypothetical protein